MAIAVNTVAPAITGTAEVGQTLTSSTGTWTGGVTSYSYQWQRMVGGTPTDIAGATNNQYVITSLATGQTIRVGVRATNNDGTSAYTYSAETAIVADGWFIVEDGTAKTNAVTYCGIDAANVYHAHKGNVSWATKTLGEKKAALVNATNYMEQVYRLRWKGVRKTANQALSWPREWVEREDYYAVDSAIPDSVDGTFYYPSNQIPVEVVNACADLAFRALTEDLSPDIDRLTQREKLGPLEVEYSQYSKPYKVFRAIDNLLSILLKSSGSGAFRTLERV